MVEVGSTCIALNASADCFAVATANSFRVALGLNVVEVPMFIVGKGIGVAALG